MSVLITLLIVVCIMLTVTCGFLAWLWRDQRKTIDQLAETLTGVLRGKSVRANGDGGDASRLPDPGRPDQ